MYPSAGMNAAAVAARHPVSFGFYVKKYNSNSCQIHIKQVSKSAKMTETSIRLPSPYKCFNFDSYLSKLLCVLKVPLDDHIIPRLQIT
jgi:hypothetical protein